MEIRISDMTREEAAILQLVKQKMLQKLVRDRDKFIFVYCYEMGHTQSEAATVLGISDALLTRYMKRIRQILTPFRKQY